MQGKQVYEYAFIRVVPRVERGEFVNVGVMTFCKRKRYLGIRYQIDEKRLLALAPGIDLEEVSQYLRAWELICLGDAKGGRIALLDPAERFRWLTAAKSTIIQASPVHPGLCIDPEQVLQDLFEKYVR